jgi:hypothetical protein
MMAKRKAVAINTIAILIIVVVAIVAVAFISNGGASSSVGSSKSLTSAPSVTTITSTEGSASTSSSNSVTTQECDNGSLPTNSSSSSDGQLLTRMVFNVTQAFDSWNWSSLSTFTVGSYKFELVGSQNTQTKIYLEPEVLINVTNSQGQTQPTDMTDLGSFNGNTWPPELSGGPSILFSGSVTIQWLFPCNSQDVFLEIIAK